MEEKRNLLQKIAKKESQEGLNILSEGHFKRVDELHRHIDRLKQLDLYREENRGRMTVKTDPFPFSLFTRIVPPCRRTISDAI